MAVGEKLENLRLEARVGCGHGDVGIQKRLQQRPATPACAHGELEIDEETDVTERRHS